MPGASRLLQDTVGWIPPPPPPEPFSVDSDVIVILAALLCALICVVGLALVARCAWLRRYSIPSSNGAQPPTPLNKGLKKKALQALPKVSFDPASAAAVKIADCAICLAEFAEGDEIRILPQCEHGFHAVCVDTWLGSHSSCPFCRQILIVAAPSRCRTCGSGSSAVAEGVAKLREDSNAGNRR
ncbi:Zinc finger RING/FYVE/PHD-type protein [Dioscorea alata]|uniref:Zinc finger RING/FYVE/PHD-type protein n=1 Tax=Dioscorea alata TaxID=55571 RepID=A0ACB7V7C3_DIOAL|nr:Zinc finger RING/FYVE/PHD-type protein [Dioscorea alata]